jgi:hypothetical protein
LATVPTLGQLGQLVRWLLGDALSWANIAQIPALFLTGGVAWILCHPVRARISAWADRHPDHHHLDWLAHHRPLATRRLVPLITPAVWAIGLWISVAVAEYGGWPHAVAQVAVNLLLAWLVIRLAAEMVPNPVLARLIAVLSWSVAALNITHLLGPTLELLDSAAIVVSGLRVSLLTVTKGVLSLTILLWPTSLRCVSGSLTHSVAFTTSKSEVLYEVWRLFRQEGIQIPYSKRDLYVRSTDPN